MHFLIVLLLSLNLSPALAVKRITYDEFIKEDETYLSSFSEIHLLLPEKMTVLNHPILISGKLTLEHEGLKPGRLAIRSNIIAKKSITLVMPHHTVTFGDAADTEPPIKLQAEEGNLILEANSLHIPKAQFYSLKGITLTSPDNHIPISKPVGPLSYQSICNYKDCFRQWYWDSIVQKQASNGTSLITKGGLTLTSKGCTLYFAEISILGGDFVVTSKSCVDNIGGKIFVSGNGNLKDVVLKNRVYTQDITYTEVCTLEGYMTLTFVYPVSPKGEIIINGNLITQSLDNYGSFVHVAGTLVEQNAGPKRDFDFMFSLPSLIFYDPTPNEKVKAEYKSIVSFGKGSVVHKGSHPKIEGVYQGPVWRLHFVGDALIGRTQNYQRPAIKSFEAKKPFALDRSSGLFIPNLMPSARFKHQPSVPLSFTLDLPPAVGIARQRLFLLNDTDQFLYHPLQEIEALPRTFAEQLNRGHLDSENPNTLKTYVMGRQAAYDLYREMFATKPAGAAPDALLPLSQALSQRDKPIKFMIPYEGLYDEGTTVYSPVSILSTVYDNPAQRNPDGGVFVDSIDIEGDKESTLTICSTLHGENNLRLKVPNVTVEQQAATWVTYHTNTTKKKRFIGCSESTETVAIHHSVAQPTTGLLSTGKKGQAELQVDQLNLKQGGKVQVGDKGLEVNIKTLTASPAVNMHLGYSESRSGRNSASRYFSVPTIMPATISSAGGIKGRVGSARLDASNLIALDQDIDLSIHKDAELLAHKETQSLGVSVRKDAGTVSISEGTTEVGLPSSIIALNGSVRLTIGGELKGKAPQFYAKKKIDVTSKTMHVAVKPLDTKTHSKTIGFPSFTSYINETVREHHQSALFPTIFSGEGATFLTTDGDAYLQAPNLSGDYTQKATGGDSVIDSVLLDHFIDVEQDTFTFSNLSLDLAQSAIKGDFAGALRTIQQQFPLLTTVRSLARAHDGADVAEGAVKTAYQSYQLLSELNGAGSISDFAKNRLTRVGFGATSSTTSTHFTTAAVPHVLTPTSVTLESTDGEARAVGLTGTLSNLMLKGQKGAILDVPKEQGSTFSTSDGVDVSLGFSNKGFSVRIGNSESQSQSQFTRYTYQPLTVLGTTTLESDGDIHINTPFTTARSHFDGRQIYATTMQDSYTSSQSSSHTSLGLGITPTGITVSGGFNGTSDYASSRTASHPTVITSTMGSNIRAREKVVLLGAAFLSHGPGTYTTPVTEAYDLEDETQSTSTRYGCELSSAGAIPGFAEFGSESKRQSGTHRATLGSNYQVTGNAGTANRDDQKHYLTGPSDSTHFWFGAPIVTNSAEALKEMHGGLNVLGNAFTLNNSPASTNILSDDLIEALTDLAAEQNFDPAAFVEDVVNEVITQNTRNDTSSDTAIDLIVDDHFAQRPQEYEMLLWDVAKDTGKQPKVSDYKAYVRNSATFISDILFDLAQERQDNIIDTQEKVMCKTGHMTVGKLSKLIGLTVIGTLNEFLDSFSWFPSPAGLISSIGAAGRDIISEKTTVKDYALESAFGIGLLKGVGYTVKGLKSVYKKSASFFEKGEQTIIKPVNSNRPYLPFTHHTKANVPMQHQTIFKKWTTGTISDDLVLTPSHGYEMLRSKFTVDSKGPFNVLAHGNPHQLYVHSKDIHPKALSQDNLVLLQVNGHVALDDVQAARLIRTAPGYVKGQPINLMACKTGELSYGFAQRLADRINVPVSAFTTNVQLLKGGDFTSVNRETYEIGILRTFYPKK